MKLAELVSTFEDLWPVSQAEPWDVVGLVSGNPNNHVSNVLLTVDLTHDVIEEAKTVGADLILAHHPFLLKGVTNLSELTSKGSVIAELIRNNIALYSAHTNADSSKTGTSTVLAKAIGLAEHSVLAESNLGNGIGIIGTLAIDVTLGELAAKLNSVLPQTASGVRVAGDFDRKVSKVALCAGAGDSYLQLALDSGADLYITSDLRHHPALEILEQAKAKGREFALVDISHWAAEYLWLDQAKQELGGLPIEISISDIRTDVFDFLMNLPKGEN
ncbi:MAG: Nif3-like dinuclear metal center hexameric protein [Rhodoluna sp.]